MAEMADFLRNKHNITKGDQLPSSLPSNVKSFFNHKKPFMRTLESIESSVTGPLTPGPMGEKGGCSQLWLAISLIFLNLNQDFSYDNLF